MKSAILLASSLAISVASAASLPVARATTYPITGDDVKCREKPSTSSDIKKTYKKGTEVSISCQSEGTNISGNSIWDKTQDGCYVSDYYVKTGSSGYVADKCDGGGCGAPKSNQATIDLIAVSEGFVDHIYIDATGHPTVGYGHLCSDSKCSDVSYSIPLSQADGKKLLASDMAKYEKCITDMVDAKMNLNQYGAIVSWSFNMGCGAAQGSQLIKRVNAGEDVNTVYAAELPKWVHGDGNEVLPGLVKRRKAEIALAKEPTDDKALPVDC